MLALELAFCFLLLLDGFLWAFFFWRALQFIYCSRDAVPAAPAPPRTISARSLPSVPPPSPKYWPGSLDDPTAKPRPFAWERQQPSSSATTTKEDERRIAAWQYLARFRESKQTKLVRFAPSMSPPSPVPVVAPTPVVEPFDPEAWLARLRAFQEAISMPTCSLFPDPKLVLGSAVPVQQHMLVRTAEMLQHEQAPAAAPEVLSLPPKNDAVPPSAPPTTTTATDCAAEISQQEQPPPSPPKSSSQPPAVPPVQDPSAVDSASTAAKPAASSGTSALPSGSIFGNLPALPGALPPSDGLNTAQLGHRATMKSALDVLETVKRAGDELGGKPDQLLPRGWQAYAKQSRNQRALTDLVTALRRVKETGTDDLGGLKESAMPRALLQRMLVKGDKFQEMLRGFEAGESVLSHSNVGAGPVQTIVKVMREMSNLFG